MPETPALRITTEPEGAATRLGLAGELDLATADILRDHVAQLLASDGNRPNLVMDLAAVEFVDVTGLGALLDARRRATSLGGGITLRRPRPMVVRMLNLLKLEDALAVEP